MYSGKKVSVVLATYREKKSIRRIVEDFFPTGFIEGNGDYVIVCEPDGTFFNTELILLTISEGMRFVEIPITYCKRIGRSAIVEEWYKVVI